MKAPLILFDLGGVIYGSPLRAIRRFESKLELNKSELGQCFSVSKAFEMLELGRISRNEFAPLFHQEISQQSSRLKDRISLQNCKDLLEEMESEVKYPNLFMLDVLDCLRANTSSKLGVVTNDWLGCFDEAVLCKEVIPRLDFIVRSHQVHLRKPQREVFELVLQMANLRTAQNCIMIDDLGANLKGAREAGFTTIKAIDDPPDDLHALKELHALLNIDVIPTEKVENFNDNKAKLVSFLKANQIVGEKSGGDVKTIRKFKSGQSNPTFLIDTGEHSPDRLDNRIVLRRKPIGDLKIPTAHRIDREYKLLEALSGHVPLPKPRIFSSDTSIVGSHFYLMDFIPSRCILDPDLPTVTSASEARKMYESLLSTLAQLHAVDYKQVGLANFGKPSQFFTRQLERWSSQTTPNSILPVFFDIEKHLKARLAPLDADNECSIIHGDYRIDNVLFHPYESRVVSIVDLELSTLGHPYSDLFLLIAYHDVMREGYLTGKASDKTLKNKGVPTDGEIIDMYFQKKPVQHSDKFNDLMAFSYWKIAAIFQGVFERSKTGQSSNKRAVVFGQGVPYLLRKSEEYLNGQSKLER